MSQPNLSAIPSDVISNLGQYMNLRELSGRRGIDPIWDLARLELVQNSNPIDLIDLAIETDDSELASDVIITHGAQSIPLDEYISYAVQDESFNVVQVLLDAWSTTPIDDISKNLRVIDSVRRLSRRRVSNNALSKLFQLISQSRLDSFINVYGLRPTRDLLIVGLSRNLAGSEYLKGLLVRSAEDTMSGSYRDNLKMLLDVVKWNNRSNPQAIRATDSVLLTYLTEADTVGQNLKDELTSYIQRL